MTRTIIHNNSFTCAFELSKNLLQIPLRHCVIPHAYFLWIAIRLSGKSTKTFSKKVLFCPSMFSCPSFTFLPILKTSLPRVREGRATAGGSIALAKLGSWRRIKVTTTTWGCKGAEGGSVSQSTAQADPE